MECVGDMHLGGWRLLRLTFRLITNYPLMEYASNTFGSHSKHHFLLLEIIQAQLDSLEAREKRDQIKARTAKKIVTETVATFLCCFL